MMVIPSGAIPERISLTEDCLPKGSIDKDFYRDDWVRRYVAA
jgi:hypothetical protein